MRRQVPMPLLVLAALWLLAASPALAYLDPGSGSMLLQLLLGGIAGLFVLIRLYWQRLVAKLSRKPPQGGPEEPTRGPTS